LIASVSAKLATTCIPFTFVRVTNAEVELDDELDEPTPLEELEDELLAELPPPEVCAPTLPFTAAATPSIGARNVVCANAF